MKKLSSRLPMFLLLCLLSLNIFGFQDNETYYNQLINKSSRDIFTNPDFTINSYKEGIDTFKQEGDTLKTIRLLCELADLYAQLADYNNSYDKYWESLILAEQFGSEETKAKVYNGLGWLYSFYQRKEIAIKYYNLSLLINRKNTSKSATKNQLILDDYYALATLYRKSGDLEFANLYLDSCSKMLNGPLDTESNRAFIQAERGYLHFKANQLSQSLVALNDARSFFESYDSSYLIVLYPFLGDLHKDKNNLIISEEYYKKSISISEIYKSHLDLIPDVYLKLSELYYKQGKYKLAHEFILKSNQLNEKQFGSRSVNNRRLLEIKDDFRLEKERQDEEIQQQKLATLEQVNQNQNLQLLILLLSLFSIIFTGVLINRNLRAKHKAEKQFLQHQKIMEAQKNLEVIEVKNKELTSSALHVIEKEELLAEIKNELLKQKDHPNPIELNKVIKRITLSTNQSWKEFELRFLQVNKDFYRRLRDKHASLSQNDHKICALIKLNFSSKDMATLLGISIESVHTNRYRLRKKMGLDRRDNLEDYISQL